MDIDEIGERVAVLRKDRTLRLAGLYMDAGHGSKEFLAHQSLHHGETVGERIDEADVHIVAMDGDAFAHVDA